MRIRLIKPDPSGQLRTVTVTSPSELHRLQTEGGMTFILVMKVGDRLKLLRSEETAQMEGDEEVYAIPPAAGG